MSKALVLLSLLSFWSALTRGFDVDQLIQIADGAESYGERMMAAMRFIQSNTTLKAAWDQHITQYRQQNANVKHGTQNFRCETTKSKTAPTSVHGLTPGDIQVIGAIGDSLSAGTGIDALTPIGLLIEWRGQTWSAGGDRTLEDFITVPNVLKKYNKELYGYAVGNTAVGGYFFPNARFNQAVPAAISSAIPNQAERLVRKMKKSKEIDFENDWKMITVFIGGNDICGSCKLMNKGKRSAEWYVDNIRQGLDYFHEHVPRVFVNVVLMLDVGLIKETNSNNLICQILHVFECHCGAYPRSEKASAELQELTQQYIKQLNDLVESGRYDTRDDFTVVAQPFFTETKLPRRDDGKADTSYFAVDCFHLSQKGQEAAALSLWNNMLEPVGEKRREWHFGEDFECPTRDRPFLATYKNSGSSKLLDQPQSKDVLAVDSADEAPENRGSTGENDGASEGGSVVAAIVGAVVGLIAVACIVLMVALVVKRRKTNQVTTQVIQPGYNTI